MPAENDILHKAIRLARSAVATPGRREKIIIALLCLITAVRIFVFSAIFPFFSNVDEEFHFDTVVKYSRGYLPHAGGAQFDRKAAELIAAYQTPYFLAAPEVIASGQLPPPLYVFSKETVASLHETHVNVWMNSYINHETFSPPVYYMTAGLWLNLGRILGFEGADLLYWSRFFNVLAVSFLPWVAYLFAGRFFPDNRFMRLGLPLMTAFLPQDAFYAISNDALSPLFFSIALYLLLDLYFTKSSGYWRYAYAGLFIAATFLTKFSNVAIVGISVVIVCLKMLQIYRRKLAGELPKIFLLVLSAALPVVVWLGRNYLTLGDISGTAAKTSALTWSVKPFDEMWGHPIFSSEGFAYFWSEIMRTFWRGEFVWQGTRLMTETADWFYIISSSLFILAAGIGLFLRRRVSVSERFTTGICLLIVAFSVIFLAGLSIVFDFGICQYPSRENPFLTSGRLLIGMIIPLLAVYLAGLNLILSKLKIKFNPIFLVIIIAVFITYSEISITCPIFSNEHNWFNIEDNWDWD
ncbi:MAG: DUF2142 domain-containing protein [Thermodesulfovibrionales bacterium]